MKTKLNFQKQIIFILNTLDTHANAV